MTVKEIISDYLIKNGYEGLWNEDSECGCAINDNFMPCSDGSCVFSDCQPGYILPGNEEYDFMIGPEKEHEKTEGLGDSISKEYRTSHLTGNFPGKNMGD